MKDPLPETENKPDRKGFRIGWTSSGHTGCSFDIRGPALSWEDFAKVHAYLDAVIDVLNAGLPRGGDAPPELPDDAADAVADEERLSPAGMSVRMQIARDIVVRSDLSGNVSHFDVRNMTARAWLIADVLIEEGKQGEPK